MLEIFYRVVIFLLLNPIGEVQKNDQHGLDELSLVNTRRRADFLKGFTNAVEITWFGSLMV